LGFPSPTLSRAARSGHASTLKVGAGTLAREGAEIRCHPGGGAVSFSCACCNTISLGVILVRLWFLPALLSALPSGQVPEARLDDAVLRMLTPMYALGIMDRPATGDLSVDATDPARAALARDIAAAATVLLKNDKVCRLREGGESGEGPFFPRKDPQHGNSRRELGTLRTPVDVKREAFIGLAFVPLFAWCLSSTLFCLYVDHLCHWRKGRLHFVGLLLASGTCAFVSYAMLAVVEGLLYAGFAVVEGYCGAARLRCFVLLAKWLAHLGTSPCH